MTCVTLACQEWIVNCHLLFLLFVFYTLANVFDVSREFGQDELFLLPLLSDSLHALLQKIFHAIEGYDFVLAVIPASTPAVEERG